MKIYYFSLFITSRNTENKMFVWDSVCHCKPDDSCVWLCFPHTVEYDCNPGLTREWREQSFLI